MRVQIGAEILRRIVEAGDDPLVNVGDQAVADLVENALLVDRAHFLPVDRQLALMRHGRQHVEGAVPRRRHRGIGDGRVVQVEREVLGQHAMIVDVVEQPLVARAEQDHVVRNAGPVALDAEMRDEKRRREALALEARRRALAPARLAEQVAIAVHDIGIARDRVEAFAPAALGHHAGDLVAHGLDLDDRIIEPQGPSDPLEMPDHARDEPVGAAFGEPHAAILFQLMDQRVDRTGLHRIAADQQRVERQRLAQLLVLHER